MSLVYFTKSNLIYYAKKKENKKEYIKDVRRFAKYNIAEQVYSYDPTSLEYRDYLDKWGDPSDIRVLYLKGISDEQAQMRELEKAHKRKVLEEHRRLRNPLRLTEAVDVPTPIAQEIKMRRSQVIREHKAKTAPERKQLVATVTNKKTNEKLKLPTVEVITTNYKAYLPKEFKEHIDYVHTEISKADCKACVSRRLSKDLYLRFVDYCLKDATVDTLKKLVEANEFVEYLTLYPKPIKFADLIKQKELEENKK